MAASGEKPYRVYKGGRQKGKVPTPQREREERQRSTYRAGGDNGGREVRRRPKRGWTWKRWTWVTLLAVVVLLVVWSVAGYLSVRSGVKAANDRLSVSTASVLQKQNSLLLTSGTNILLLGTDHSTNGQAGRDADQHSDSMMLLHTDPSRHRLVFLSVPRDLRASIPGHGEQKINAAMQIGGPKLAIQAADELFGSGLR
jgi:anionic cell wall polymer biosynthesis LytR-Cps2A-Psr (LCP) family protein